MSTIYRGIVVYNVNIRDTVSDRATKTIVWNIERAQHDELS